MLLLLFWNPSFTAFTRLSWTPQPSVPPFLEPDSSMENAASPTSRDLLQIRLLDDAELIRMHKCTSIVDVAVANLITSFANAILSFMRFYSQFEPRTFLQHRSQSRAFPKTTKRRKWEDLLKALWFMYTIQMGSLPTSESFNILGAS